MAGFLETRFRGLDALAELMRRKQPRQHFERLHDEKDSRARFLDLDLFGREK